MTFPIIAYSFSGTLYFYSLNSRHTRAKFTNSNAASKFPIFSDFGFKIDLLDNQMVTKTM